MGTYYCSDLYLCCSDFFVCFQVHRKYTGEDFDEDLRTVLRRSGCKNEKIAFIMDESNVLDSGFLERMNTLLANGEVSCFHRDPLFFATRGRHCLWFLQKYLHLGSLTVLLMLPVLCRFLACLKEMSMPP